MKILVADEIDLVSGGSVLAAVEHAAVEVGHAVENAAKTAAGFVVGLVKGYSK